jgi:DNA-binding response OmpR family regulator
MTRVLVVEDDAQTAAEIAAALGDHGFEVECAHTGQDALDRAVADRYSAIVLDRMLPGGIDGLTVLSTLRGHERRCACADPECLCRRWTSASAACGRVAMTI